VWYEDPSVVAIGVTLVAGVAVAAFLSVPLTVILIGYAGSKARGRFWAAVSQVLVVLVPVGLVAIFAPMPDSPRAFAPAPTIDLLKWGLIGLIGTVVLLAGVIGVFGRCHGATVFIDPDQFDDLNRLLSKVRELRARELLDQLDREPLHAAR
jgi:hypothetical protein